ncbi:hypothetical protein ACFQZ4_38785 [Catellatospora coxensis]|uniref:DUF998 domain-containing protein n=1 Tax=Catellatospora coxensis TaxID=310354 RepID=A0A8J3KNW9_9ACTN|nr:hypothetical protein [Catellatospora coxensis]GIG05993.1 hypothetical protein Cco03nite_26930 [Catellatospora coxensis]
MGPLARRGAVFAGFAAATALAAYALHDTNLAAWTWFNFDPQGFEQELWAWQTAGAFTATSGTLVAQLGALLFGRYAARAGANLPAALAGGLGLAVAQLAVAVPMAVDRLNGKGMAIEMARHGHPFDPALWRQPAVATAVLATTLSCLAWAAVGHGIARHTGHVGWAVLAGVVVLLHVAAQAAFMGAGPWWAPAVPLLVPCVAAAVLASRDPAAQTALTT